MIRVIRSRKVTWAGHVGRLRGTRNAYKMLAGRYEGKRSLGRPRRRWEDNSRLDLREIRCDDTDWIHLPEGTDQWRTLVNTAVHHRVP